MNPSLIVAMVALLAMMHQMKGLSKYHFCFQKDVDHFYRCFCPNTTDFYKVGRHCEVYEMSLTGAKYFYVLPNTVALIIEFSLYSTAHQGFTEIFRIPDSNGRIFVRYQVSNSNHTLEIANRAGYIPYPLDKGNFWLNIFINISKEVSQLIL